MILILQREPADRLVQVHHSSSSLLSCTSLHLLRPDHTSTLRRSGPPWQGPPRIHCVRPLVLCPAGQPYQSRPGIRVHPRVPRPRRPGRSTPSPQDDFAPDASGLRVHLYNSYSAIEGAYPAQLLQKLFSSDVAEGQNSIEIMTFLRRHTPSSDFYHEARSTGMLGRPEAEPLDDPQPVKRPDLVGRSTAGLLRRWR